MNEEARFDYGDGLSPENLFRTISIAVDTDKEVRIKFMVDTTTYVKEEDNIDFEKKSEKIAETLKKTLHPEENLLILIYKWNGIEFEQV